MAEKLSAKEQITDKDGKPTPYFIRLLKDLGGAGGGGPIGRFVRSVNGMTGDVILTAENLGLGWVRTAIDSLGAAIDNAVARINAAISGIAAAIAEAVDTHNTDIGAHSYLSAEHSIQLQSHRNESRPEWGFYFPHLYGQGYTDLTFWTSTANTGMNLAYTYPSNGAGADQMGSDRNVIISALYIPFRSIRIRGIMLPCWGGQVPGGAVTEAHATAIKAALYSSKPVVMDGGRRIKGAYKGSKTVSFDRTAGDSTMTVTFGSAGDWADINPQVGDYLSCVNVGSATDVRDGMILTIDEGALEITFYTQDTGAASGSRQYFFWASDTSGAACRWLNQQLWSTLTSFDDYAPSNAFQEEGWVINASLSNSEACHLQSQVVGWNQSPSIACDITLTEGIYFLAIVQAKIGTTAVNTAIGSIGISLPIAPTTASVTTSPSSERSEGNSETSTSQVMNTRSRGLISSSWTPWLDDAAGAQPVYAYNAVTAPNATLANRVTTSKGINAVNTFVCFGVSDADTVAALDNCSFSTVFPDIPYNGDTAMFAAYTPEVAAAYAAPANSAYNVPFFVPPILATYGVN